MQINIQEISKKLETRFFLPQWWVNAYEALMSVSDDQIQFSNMISFGIAPQMNVLELNALAHILSKLQHSIIHNCNLKVDLNLKELSWDFIAGPKARAESFESVVSKLGGIRNLKPGQTENFKFESFFEDEVWKLKDGNAVLSLTIPCFQEDKILGYLDPYFLWTQVDHQSNIDYFKSKLNSHCPVSIWKSIWLDLSGAEQALLLRLEKKIQWNEDWLHIEGVFDINFEVAFQGLKLPVFKDSMSNFLKKIQVLKKLGKKLVEHGFLSTTVVPDYLIFNRSIENKSVNITWQVATERLYVEDTWQYIMSTCKYYLSNALTKHKKKFIAWISAGVSLDAYYEQFSDVITQMEKNVEQNGLKSKQVFVLKNNIVITLQHLFLEWHIRQYPGHLFPLPAEIIDSYAAHLASPYAATMSNVIQNFEAFVAEVIDNPSYFEVLNKLEFATLVSELSFLNVKVFEWSRNLSDKYKQIGLDADIIESKPQLVYSKEDKSEPPHIVSSPHSIKENVEINARQTIVSNETSLLESTSAGRFAKNQMKKIAAEELKKIQQESPEKYQKLKNIFLDSLAPDQRRIFEGVRIKMAPSSFEALLKGKLMDFMVENPSAWTANQNDPQNLLKQK